MSDRIFKAAGFSVLSMAGALALAAFASPAQAAGDSSALSFNALNPFAILSQVGTIQGPADPSAAASVPAADNNKDKPPKPKKSKKEDGDDGNHGGGNG
jgi:hypothetical protein